MHILDDTYPAETSMPTREHLQPALVMIAISALTSNPATAATLARIYKGHELANEAKVTIEQARQIALKARKGKITDEELEREPGGSGLRYSFDIREGKIVYEVGVDAANGKVLENHPESSNPD